ncbi:hypothetical protein N7540_003316 [Penicillium herquei]|nr:hypothetical protein N7540_003316 [Penicillium herquei]
MHLMPYLGEIHLSLVFSILISGVSTSPLSSLGDFDQIDPVAVSVTPSYVSNVFENTHTATIGPNGHATPLPIVGGPECWFCPEGNHGNTTDGAWALLDIDSPGKYQPTSIDGFTEVFPVITVSSNGDPSYAPSQTTKEAATKVKRIVTKSTETTWETSDAYKLFEANLPQGVEISANNAYAYAINFRTITKHWNEVERFDLQFEQDVTIEKKDRKPVALGHDTPSNVVDQYGPESEARWDYEWQWLGRVRDEFILDYGNKDAEIDVATVEGIGKRIIDNMNQQVKGLTGPLKGPGYHRWFNNCYNFKNYLWDEIKQEDSD